MAKKQTYVTTMDNDEGKDTRDGKFKRFSAPNEMRKGGFVFGSLFVPSEFDSDKIYVTISSKPPKGFDLESLPEAE